MTKTALFAPGLVIRSPSLKRRGEVVSYFASVSGATTLILLFG